MNVSLDRDQWIPTRSKGWYLRATVGLKPFAFRVNSEAQLIGFVRGAWNFQPKKHAVYVYREGSTAEVTYDREVTDERFLIRRVRIGSCILGLHTTMQTLPTHRGCDMRLRICHVYLHVNGEMMFWESAGLRGMEYFVISQGLPMTPTTVVYALAIGPVPRGQFDHVCPHCLHPLVLAGSGLPQKDRESEMWIVETGASYDFIGKCEAAKHDWVISKLDSDLTIRPANGATCQEHVILGP